MLIFVDSLQRSSYFFLYREKYREMVKEKKKKYLEWPFQSFPAFWHTCHVAPHESCRQQTTPLLLYGDLFPAFFVTDWRLQLGLPLEHFSTMQLIYQKLLEEVTPRVRDKI